MVFCNVVEFANSIGFELRHNPYFNRWFSAIIKGIFMMSDVLVTILILIDGFLQ